MNPFICTVRGVKSLVMAALACAVAVPAVHAATVTLNNTTGTSCTYTSASTDSSGNVTYQCQGTIEQPPPPPPDPTTTPPQCALLANSTPNAVQIAVGGSITFSGGCLNAVGVLTSSSAGAPAAQLAVPVTFLNAGTYLYTMTGTNAGGTNSASVTVTVGSGNDAPGNPGCPATSTVGPRAGFTDIGNLRFDLKPGEIGTKEFEFPSLGRRQLKVGTIFGTSSETPFGTDVQVSVSECPGQFTNLPPGCIGNYSRNGGSLYVGDTTECELADGKTYYVNLRHVKYQSNPAVNSCVSPPFGYCTHYTRFNSF